MYRCGDCLPTKATFSLPATTCGATTNIWLDGRATWNCHSFKLEIDKLNAQNQPVAQYHYETTLWRAPAREQLDALYTFVASTSYRVKVTAYNNCGSRSVWAQQFNTTFNPEVCTSVSTPEGAKQTLPSSSTSLNRP